MVARLLLKSVTVWQAILAAALLSLGLVVWSIAVIEYQAFPYRLIHELRAFARGHPGDSRSIIERLRAELTHDPTAFRATSQSQLLSADRLHPVHPSAEAGGVMPDLSDMRYFSAISATRYFVLFGSFVFPDLRSHWGAIAVGSDGAVHRGWSIRPERFEYLGGHIGLAVSQDGLVLTNAHGVLSAYDWCGDKRWEAPWRPHPDGVRRDHDAPDGYDWHHDITVRDGLVYTFLGPAVVAVDERTGAIVSEVHVLDLMAWARRDGLSLFDTRRRKQFVAASLSRATLAEVFDADPFHFNKVDVLSAELAPRYEQFEAGDLLISARELNLVLVARPSEQRIVWWRYGLSSAQHDTTFVDGHIELFDNNPTSDPPRPRIVRLDPTEQRAETLFDLSRWRMEMRQLGNFERRGERILTVDSYAGRLISGRLDGGVEFVLENRWRRPDGTSVGLQLLNATEVEPDRFARFEDACSR